MATPVLLSMVGEMGSRVLWGMWVIQRGEGKRHFLSCLLPQCSGPFQPSVSGASKFVIKLGAKDGKVQVNVGALGHSDSQETGPV